MQIVYEIKAIKDLKAIEPKTRERIVAKIVSYADVPASQANNVKHLTGSPFFRLRVGDYRVIFSLDDDIATVMTVIRVRHRRDVYDQL
ncbi:type II toxin-antitoxin system RelE family toxin [Magnetospirillum fulvum]|uniref:mRNA interferase RelE/StbE n=1 Tax=Magnetospirillum fulvum TaxID=1082 RepID=A0A1H6IQC1_MAGFU|nr:type II toxin-antitoxin system RelE/ParE family toxin [Magnetospirillum fulvum]SEH49697.1 mRNA interferase RelE/StbE [Magnetospirillum fulvum]